MSKQVKRKITVTVSPKSSRSPATKARPSVFERLGTKAEPPEVCLNWAQTGTCSYGKTCKFAATHQLTSPSKIRLSGKGSDSTRRHAAKENAGHRLAAGERAEAWPVDEHFVASDLDLEHADPDDLEQRRIELQRELEKQMKMEKAHKQKQKRAKKESSPSSESSSSSSDSSSSSEESSSSSSSSVEARHKKVKKLKKRNSSSSSECESKRHRLKASRKATKPPFKGDKMQKTTARGSKALANSPSPVKSHKLSQTPPPKTKPATPVKKLKGESKSPRPSSPGRDKRGTPSPKQNDKDRERERKERGKEREKERERDKERLKDKDKKRDKSPKRTDVRPAMKKRACDSPHSRDRKTASPRTAQSRNASTTSSSSRRDAPKSSPPRRLEKRADSRSKERERKDARKSSRERERERERERRFAAREKEREEALARCQERQRERERLKRLQEKDEEAKRAKERSRRDDRGLDKPSGDRIERLLPLPQDRIPPARKESLEKERHARARTRRSPERQRSRSRNDRAAVGRDYDRDEYHLRLREDRRRADEKRYDAAYDRPRDERRYAMDVDSGHGHAHGYPDDRLTLERAEYADDRRRREMWDDRDDIEHRRYREDSRPPVPGGQVLKARDWVGGEYEHEWERQRHLEWESRDVAWEAARERSGIVDDEWRHYSRSMEGWSAEERERQRRWEADGWARDARDHRDSTRERDGLAAREPRDRDREREAREAREASRPHSSSSQRTDTQGKTRKEQKAERHTDRPEKTERPERSEKSERQERTERVEKPPEPPTEEAPSADEEPAEEHIEQEVEKETTKRPADSPLENGSDPKKMCIAEEPLAEDLSDFSDDDADEILNRVEEAAEALDTAESSTEHPKEASKDEEPQSEAVPQPVAAQQMAPQLPKSPNTNSITKDSIDDTIDLDFEEISEDELEEEARLKGLVDALGVDWASLVAESKPRCKPLASVKRRWDSHNVLVYSGISVALLGKSYAMKIFKQHKKAQEQEQCEEKARKETPKILESSGNCEEKKTAVKLEVAEELVNGNGPGIEDNNAEKRQENGTGGEDNDESLISHPIAAMQVMIRHNQALRKTLFANAGAHRRALSARRDLAIRRNLCKLPIKDTYSEPAKPFDPELFKSACQLFQRSL